MDDKAKFNPKISAAIRERDLSALVGLMQEEPWQISAFTPFAGGTWLHFSAREGYTDAVKLFLALGVDVNIGDTREGRAAICDACLGGHEEVVQTLLDAGSALDTSESVRNPLFSAIVGGKLSVVRALLAHGINSEVRYSGSSMAEMDAIAFALERGEMSIAREIALWNCDGDEAEANALLETGMKIVNPNDASRNS